MVVLYLMSSRMLSELTSTKSFLTQIIICNFSSVCAVNSYILASMTLKHTVYTFSSLVLNMSHIHSWMVLHWYSGTLICRSWMCLFLRAIVQFHWSDITSFFSRIPDINDEIEMSLFQFIITVTSSNFWSVFTNISFAFDAATSVVVLSF
jgi:hypothetical protein